MLKVSFFKSACLAVAGMLMFDVVEETWAVGASKVTKMTPFIVVVEGKVLDYGKLSGVLESTFQAYTISVGNKA